MKYLIKYIISFRVILDNSIKNTLYYNYEEIDYYKNNYLISH